MDDAFIADYESQFPLGWVEHRAAWQPGGRFAGWVGKHNAVVRINDVLFVHGGLDPHAPHVPLKRTNREIREALKDGDFARLMDESGPLWYRRLATTEADEDIAALDRLLDYHDAARIVVAHKPTQGAVMPRLDGRVIQVDVGLAAHYGGRLACLLIEDGRYFALHRGTRLALPLRDEGTVAYLERAAALDPAPSPLLPALKGARLKVVPK